MTAMAHIADELHHILTEEYLLSGELLALIGQEKQLLAQGDQDGLPLCLQSKHQLLDRLQAVTASRLKLLRSGDPMSASALPGQWTDSLSEFPALAERHAQLLQLVQQLHEENQSLGHMLNRKTHFITRLLDRLQPDAVAPAIYQSNGSRYHDGGTRKRVSI